MTTLTVRVHGTNGTTSAESEAVASFTPSANSRLYLCAIAQKDTHTQAFSWQDPGGGVTWTVLATTAEYNTEGLSSYATQMRVWYTDIGGTPPTISTAALQADASGSTPHFLSWFAFDVTGHNTTTPHPQAAVTNGADYGSPIDNGTGTLTLGSNPTNGNRVIGVFGTNCNTSAGPATPSGFTLLDSLQAGPYSNINIFHRDDTTATTISVTDMGEDVGSWVGIAWEIADAGGGTTYEQEGFRFRNDDGSETTATWKASQDTNASVGTEENFRLRFLINRSG